MGYVYWDRPLGNSLTGLPLLTVLTLCCGTGFLLFGYDQGVMGGLIGGEDFLNTFPSLRTNSTLLGATVAIYEIGALFGSLFASLYGDVLGRRKALIIGCFFAFTGGAVQGGSDGPNALAILIFFRIWTGLGIGVLTSLLPAFHAECSPARYRGSIVLLDLVACACGLTLSFWLSYGLSFVNNSAQWRFPLSFQAIFPLIVLFLVAVLPDSPRWLAQKGRLDEAREVLVRYNGKEEAEIIFAEIEMAIAMEQQAAVHSWFDAFRGGPQKFRYRTLLGMGALFAQQMTGVNVISYYSTVIFTESVGLSRNLALILSGCNGINSLCFVIVGMFLVDRVGRVRLMWITAACHVAFFATMAGVLHSGTPSYGEGVTGACMLFLFFATFSFGWLGPSWLYPSEVMPLATRAAGASLSSMSNWIWNFVIVMVTPPAIEGIQGYYYIVFAVTNALLVPMLLCFYPETARLSLEEIDALFADGKVHLRRSPREPVQGFIEGVSNGVKVQGETQHVEKASVSV
ncbi:sugar porter family MFS transporter [Rhodotorula paludigena]|uniref:sugar porter family MFS transporter n=1 Tax=Rhodotorula paludigena TaxID=86838 RepID=UPI00317369F0